MEGWRLHTWGGDPVWEEIPDPVAGPGEVLVDVEACGVGLTVLNKIAGDLGSGADLLPVVPGHEFAGTISALGEGAPADLLGKRVIAHFYLACGTCKWCTVDREPLCENLIGHVGVQCDGGYAPKVAIPVFNAVVIPESLDPVTATVIPDAMATPVHVAARAGIGKDDRVAVIGAGGGVGIHMIQIAAHHGAAVAGLDIAKDKLTKVADLGATAVDATDLAGLDAGGLFKDGPPTVVVDFVGSEATVRWAIDGLDTAGTLINLTTFKDRSFPFNSRELVLKELSLLGSRYASRKQLREAADLLAAGAIQPIIGETVAPQDVGQLHEQLRNRTLLGRGAMDWSLA